MWLAQWAALAAVYYLLLRGRVAPPGGWLAALAGALCLRLALGAFANAVRAAEDRRVLARCRSSRQELPQDGKRFAAVGRIAALAAPLAAPFSRVPCVAYRYQIGGRIGPTYAGCALAPAAIAAPSGSVRLLGFPFLETGFTESARDDDAAYERARAYVAATPFTRVDAARLGEVLGGAAALPTDIEGAVRRDWRVSGRQEGVGRGDRLAERVVAPGDEVCAIGLYRAAEGGVAPDASPGGGALRLLRGDGDAAAAALARDGRAMAFAGLALLVLSHALLAAWLLRGPR